MAFRVDKCLEPHRILHGQLWSLPGEGWGAFAPVPGPCGMDLRILASPGDKEIGWEHVSVSLPKRCPNWAEMCFVKDLFWDDEDVVMQLHPAKSDYVNNHPFCLHLWRPLYTVIPLPPQIAV